MKSLKQIQEEELKKFDKEFPIIQLHDPNIPFFAKDLKLEVRKFLLSAMESAARGAIENVIENAGELFEQWQGDGYVDRTSVIKQQLSTKAKDYIKEFDNQIPREGL